MGTYELVPVPCVLHPEQVREYPAPHDPDPGPAGRIARRRASQAPTDITVGRGRTLRVSGCPAGPRHLPVTVVQ
ncbi:hypothetical protein ACFQ8S_28550 [Streptomyces virginiae]|uniref:hypothetical protein n=1 Tax=Streptomyces virginiae TaxID=1961 RepID=UPI0036B47034